MTTYEHRVQQAVDRLRGVPPLDPSAPQSGPVLSPRSATHNAKPLRVQPEDVLWCDVYDALNG